MGEFGVGANVCDEAGDLGDPLFGVEVANSNSSEVLTAVYYGPWHVPIVAHSREDGSVQEALLESFTLSFCEVGGS